MTFPFELSVLRYRNMRERVPDAVFELSPGTINTHLLINRAQPPFDNPDLRLGTACTMQRKTRRSTLRLRAGHNHVILQPPPAQLEGIPPKPAAQLPTPAHIV